MSAARRAGRHCQAPAGAPGKAELRDQAKHLAREALRSKDPAVLWELGGFPMLFAGDTEKADIDPWVWRLAACKRGYDCSQDADWLKLMCRFNLNCQPYESGVDYMRRVNSAGRLGMAR